ncbi:dUTP diphosphatase [Candidatus Woesearchaeota archaeon]|nr:MAG: dUTP diphosphatase [Candidatus Woesearchaeota archaeon]
MLKVKIKLHPDGKEPLYALEGDAGLDLFTREKIVLAPGERKLAPTGVYCAIPQGYEMQIRSKSGLSLKHGVIVLNSPGTIDSNYRGEIGVILFNTSDKPVVFEKHMKVAQAVFNKIPKVEWEHVEELDETQRSSGGFGSTGR